MLNLKDPIRYPVNVMWPNLRGKNWWKSS